jgi:hypothetical protein
MHLVLHRDLPQVQLDISGLAIEEDSVKRLINALDFVTALEHRFYYQVYYKDNTKHFKAVIPVKEHPVLNSILMAPYGPNGPYGDEHEFNHLLMNDYYFFLKNNPDSVLTKWHKRLVDAGTGYHYRFGLVLGIAVEKILRKYYPLDANANLVSYPPDDLKRIVALSETLNNETLAKKIKAIIENLNNSTVYVPRQMLGDLEANQIVSQGGKKAWEESRNKYALGSDHNDDLHKGMDYTLEVQTVYYELIFNKIGYKGKYINYFADKSGNVLNYPLA